MSGSHTHKLLTAWQANSDSWIQAINHQELESRTLATNKAILSAVNDHPAEYVLDMGCGEGWLCRALEPSKRKVVGVDGVKTLIQVAKQKTTSSDYYCYDYETIRKVGLPLSGSFDIITFNFSLFEKEGTFPLLQALRPLLAENGKLIIQTVALSHNVPSGWHEENWHSLDRNFPAPFAWYYRTMQDWKKGFSNSNWKLESIIEVIHPKTQNPLSFIITASA